MSMNLFGKKEEQTPDDLKVAQPPQTPPEPTPPTPPQPETDPFINPFGQETLSPSPEIPSFDSTSPLVKNDQLSQEEIQEMIDETVEKLVEEKWESISENVEKVVEWKDSVEKQIDAITQDMTLMRETFENVEKKLNMKISSYDRDILDIGSEMKALEKIFQKIAPTLANNVNELSRITSELKSMKK